MFKVIGLDQIGKGGDTSIPEHSGLMGNPNIPQPRQTRVNNIWDPARQCFIRPSGQRTQEKTTLL